jgi:hypothetical protein
VGGGAGGERGVRLQLLYPREGALYAEVHRNSFPLKSQCPSPVQPKYFFFLEKVNVY